MRQERVIVVGGGASGMMAAGQAAECGAQVLLLERTKRLGNKLRITGKGRCNLTNVADRPDFIAHFGPNGPFLHSAFARFFNQDLIDFFAAQGVPTVVERGQRVFPASNDAHQVANALADYLRQSGARVRFKARVAELETEGGRIAGVQMEGGEFLTAKAVIVATGGASYPGTGSTGDGYRLAKALEHTIVPIRPALVPLVVKEGHAEALQGLSLKNVEATLLLDGQLVTCQFGQMLFTHFGVSGPIILPLSTQAVGRLGQGKLELSINLKPALSDEQLDRRLQRDFDRFGKRAFRNILKELLPRKMIALFVRLTGIPPDKPGHQITAAERNRLFSLLRDFRLTIVGHRPIAEAIVTAGGVSTREIDPRTMESRLVEGLYFCGEILDINADTGGYNLQAAFSTGYVAGQSAARAEVPGTYDRLPREG
ncbi:MAG: NAD(P)/FAD-dependent oxidoreductase [Anaerolineales bacterium]|nr:MAG: NAD(P)/FAD-dependent oxidoreductase [Anaerolineales bacterium]